MSLADRYDITAFDFENLSGCNQLIKEPTHKFGDCLDVLFTYVSGVVDPFVDSPLGNSDHSSISFSMKMG